MLIFIKYSFHLQVVYTLTNVSSFFLNQSRLDLQERTIRNMEIKLNDITNFYSYQVPKFTFYYCLSLHPTVLLSLIKGLLEPAHSCDGQ